MVKLDFLAANPQVKLQAEAPQQAVISCFKGKPEDWQTGLKTYRQLRYPNLWPGINLVYSGTVNRLKYHFEVQPGADPRQIRLAYRGASRVTLTDAGQLDIVTPVGGFQDDRPVAWQEVDGQRVAVTADYALAVPGEDSQAYGFRLGRYYPTRPLLLDPAVIVYAGYIGGSDWDSGYSIAVDGAGAAYVMGDTGSTEATFPVKGGPDLTFNDGYDAFVAKISSSPSAATLIAPTGAITDSTPTYQWNAVETAAKYYLNVQDSTGAVKIAKWYTAAQAGCGEGVGICAVTPRTALTQGAYQWWLRAWNDVGKGPASAPVPFEVVNP